MKKLSWAHSRSILYFIEFLLLLFLSVLLYNVFLKPEGKKTFYISAQDTSILYNTLQSNHYNMYTLDKLILPFIPLPTKGWYQVKQSNQSRWKFFSTLHTKKIMSQTMKIYAAQTSQELSQRLAKNLDLNSTILLAYYKHFTQFKEGDILAGHYSIGKDADEESVMRYLFIASTQKRKNLEKQYQIEINTPLEHKILLTIASIIQKETNNVKEMPLIASVIYNRLEKNMKLQMDGTLNYGKYSHTIITHERIQNDTTQYNTYKYKGLPPAPLCTVSMEALEAAYLPASSDYLFFMLNHKGEHTFASTYEKHLENIRAFKKNHKKKKEATTKVEDKNITTKSAITSAK